MQPVATELQSVARQLLGSGDVVFCRRTMGEGWDVGRQTLGFFERLDYMDAVTSTQSANQIQTNYMKLLVTQLQNQNPLDPMNNDQMAGQLAQFSQLQQLENMNTSFGQVLDSVQRSYASSLISKDVSFKVTGDDGSVAIQSGKVSGVVMNSDGTVQLQIGDQRIALTDVTAIHD